MVLYAMISGRLPFSDGGAMEKLLKERMKPPSFPRHARVTADCVDLVKKLLQYDPSRRLSLDEVIRHPWLRGKNEKFEE